ncbi:Lsr2 dimerization domain-containing protein [Glutamicibacter ardleyensis]|uniref:Lsr2 dimerization domain-containing protein n=1 Tax=Glutamicibacter ardleyensis TaxID=225894 RepID=UPI003FCF41C8
MAMIRVSDLSGNREAEVLQFSVGADHFEIDVTEEEKSEMLKALGTFVAVARKKSPSTEKLPANALDNKAIREWAEANGYVLKERGRLPNHIIKKYQNR